MTLENLSQTDVETIKKQKKLFNHLLYLLKQSTDLNDVEIRKLASKIMMEINSYSEDK